VIRWSTPLGPCADDACGHADNATQAERAAAARRFLRFIGVLLHSVRKDLPPQKLQKIAHNCTLTEAFSNGLSGWSAMT
jgi:hypothetical protein